MRTHAEQYHQGRRCNCEDRPKTKEEILKSQGFMFYTHGDDKEIITEALIDPILKAMHEWGKICEQNAKPSRERVIEAILSVAYSESLKMEWPDGHIDMKKFAHLIADEICGRKEEK